ncbi:MAG: hypothetical protein M3068_01855 [Gemmatimonadota bacterium]|nr:hypothetical protein [Gemmatimonadota bacterium]
MSRRAMPATVALSAGFVGGVVVGLIVWTQQTRRSRRDLFSAQPWRRLAALGYLRGHPTLHGVRLLQDYVSWEQRPGLRLTAQQILKRMEQSLH